MEKKVQIFIIHGGMTFKNKKDYLHFLKTRKVSIEEKIRWTDKFLEKHLGKNFEIIKPRMPLQDNAKYDEWKIHFERFFPQLRNNIILIGSSLGGIFLAKYLSEHKFPKKILATYLICPPYDNNLPGEDLVGGFHHARYFFFLKNLRRQRRGVGKCFFNDIRAGFIVKLGKRRRFLFFQKIYCRVFCYGENPSFKTFVLIELFNIAPNFHKCFLSNILGRRNIADISENKTVYRFDIIINQIFKRFFIAGEIRLYKLIIAVIC